MRPSSSRPPGKTHRLILADDHVLFREGLARLFERTADLEVVDEASSGEEAIEACARLQPELLLLDLVMPGLGGLETIRQLREKCPGTRVVVLTMRHDLADMQKAREAGAHGYLSKDSQPEMLFDAMRKIAAGKEIFARFEDDLSGPESATPRARLTAREVEVLTLVAEGLSNRQIAGRLGISPRTVEAHRRLITQKLRIKNLASLVRYAIRHGLVSP